MTQLGRDIRSPLVHPQAQIQYQTRLLRSLSSWVLKTSKGGDPMICLGPYSNTCCLYTEDFFSYTLSEPPLVQTLTTVSYFPTKHLSKEPVSIFSIPT